MEDPICGVGGTITTCALTALTEANKSAAANTADRRTPNEGATVVDINVFLSGLKKMRNQHTTPGAEAAWGWSGSSGAKIRRNFAQELFTGFYSLAGAVCTSLLQSLPSATRRRMKLH